MDIKCPKCAEPWEIDTIHDYVDECGSDFNTQYKLFRTKGCGVAFSEWGVTCAPVDSDQTYILGEMADLFGDDVDGYASLIEDFSL